MSTLHIVKSWTMFFADIVAGTRTSDIRLNDRRYAVGDNMLLNEWDPVKNVYTGHKALVRITYMQQNKSNPCAILHDAIKDGYAVLSIRHDLQDKIAEVLEEIVYGTKLDKFNHNDDGLNQGGYNMTRRVNLALELLTIKNGGGRG